MQIEVFTLCDAATDNFGKLNILGSFDTIIAPQLPLIYPQCAVAMRIRFDAIESGEHKINVNFVDLDGKYVIPPASGSLVVNLPERRSSGAFNFILNMQGVRLEKYTEHCIDLAVDGKREASLPLFVVKEKE
jgi:hypothetical protein